MQGLKIVSKEGGALTKEEIDAAHKVANTHGEMGYGVISQADPSTGVTVEYHAYKKLAITQGGGQLYFGYGNNVEMRCRCKSVTLQLTSALEAKERIGVFLTDGTELASFFSSFSQPEYNGRFSNRGYISIVERGNNLGEYEYVSDVWAGGDTVYIIRQTNDVPETAAASTINIGKAPKDACYFKMEKPTALDVYLLTDLVNKLKKQWNTDQITAYARENTRRLRCSHAQQLLLRNGFVPPEFEYFIRTSARKSTKIRRKHPMTIVSRSSTLDSDTTNQTSGDQDKTWTHKVTLSYVIDGVEKFKEFSGTLRYKKTVANTDAPSTVLFDPRYVVETYTYTNFPFLANDATGTVVPLPSTITNAILTNKIFKETLATGVWSDLQAEPLMVEANGVFLINENWVENDTYFTPTYEPVPSGTPPFEKTSNNVTLTHPQFLLDYFKVSPPIEFETNSAGEKVAVTPSTDWLSSRMNDGEEFKVVPLNFVQGIELFEVKLAGDDRQIKILIRVNGNDKEIISGSKTTDAQGNVTYNRYYNLDADGAGGILKTTGVSKIETIASSKEYRNVMRNIKDGVFDVKVDDHPNDTLDQLLDRTVFGNKGMFPYRTKKSTGEQEIDHALVYGYAVVKYEQDDNTLKVKKWVEFTEDGKIDIYPDDDVELDDELDPTEITITRVNPASQVGGKESKKYKLAPRVIPHSNDLGNTNCVCIGNKAPWTDLKELSKQQKEAIAQDSPATPEMRLYKAVAQAIK